MTIWDAQRREPTTGASDGTIFEYVEDILRPRLQMSDTEVASLEVLTLAWEQHREPLGGSSMPLKWDALTNLGDGFQLFARVVLPSVVFPQNDKLALVSHGILEGLEE